MLASLSPEDASTKSAGLIPASEILQRELDEMQEVGQEVEMTPSHGAPEDEKEDSGEHYEEVD